MAIAALDFDSAGSTRRVDHGSDASIDDLPNSAFSFYVKLKETTQANNSHAITKSGSGPNSGWQMSVDTGKIRVIVFYATTILDYITTNLEVVTSEWDDAYVDIDASRSAGDRVRIYVGTETLPLVAVAMTATSEPTGAYVSDAGASLWVGNIERANTNPFRGQVQKFFLSNVTVALDEVQKIAWEVGTTLLAAVTGGVAADEYDDTGATQTALINSTALDGTITGATAVTTGLYDYPSEQAVTDTGIIFSPFNWRSVGGSGTMQSNNILPTGTTAAISNNPGAYIKLNVAVASGGNGACAVKLDPSNFASVTIPPQIHTSVDAGPWTVTTLDVESGIIDISNGGLDANATSLVEMFFKGVDLDDPDDRWTTPNNALVVEGIYIDSDASISSFTKKTNDMIVIGDSYSEGAAVDGGTAALANNNAQSVWWNMVANALDAEVGAQAFGGAGYIRGINNVAASSTNPAIYNSTNANEYWDKYSNGQSKLVSGAFVPVPDYIFIMAGRNDSSSITTNLTNLIDDIRTAAGTSAWIFVITDHGGSRASEVAAGVAAAADTSKVKNLVLDVYFTISEASRYSNDTSHPNPLLQSFIAAQVSELACTEINAGGGGLLVHPGMNGNLNG